MSEDVRLILADAAEWVPTLPSESVDALVTDPPFGIGFDYGGRREAACSAEDYWRWLGPLYREALRCVRPGGFVAVWQSQLYFRRLWDWFGEGIHVYAACKNFVQLRPTPINHGYDPVVVFYKPGAKPLAPEGWWRNLDFYVANTSDMRTRTDTRWHPCPRPPDQVRELLENFVVEGGLVLDPFAGSGTAALACLQTGRRFVGCEVRPDYHGLASRRIEEARSEGPLFARQAEMFAGEVTG